MQEERYARRMMCRERGVQESAYVRKRVCREKVVQRKQDVQEVTKTGTVGVQKGPEKLINLFVTVN